VMVVSGGRRQESTLVPQAKDLRRALAAVRSSLSRQDHRRLTASSLALTKTIVFSSFTPRKPRSFFPNIRMNPFPQTHEHPRALRTLYTFHSMSPFILRPNWQVEALRPRSLCFGLLLEAATRTTPDGNTNTRINETQDGDLQFSPAMFASIVSIVH
jgi:hypothetical protein